MNQTELYRIQSKHGKHEPSKLAKPSPTNGKIPWILGRNLSFAFGIRFRTCGWPEPQPQSWSAGILIPKKVASSIITSIVYKIVYTLNHQCQYAKGLQGVLFHWYPSGPSGLALSSLLSFACGWQQLRQKILPMASGKRQHTARHGAFFWPKILQGEGAVKWDGAIPSNDPMIPVLSGFMSVL